MLCGHWQYCCCYYNYSYLGWLGSGSVSGNFKNENRVSLDLRQFGTFLSHRISLGTNLCPPCRWWCPPCQWCRHTERLPILALVSWKCLFCCKLAQSWWIGQVKNLCDLRPGMKSRGIKDNLPCWIISRAHMYTIIKQFLFVLEVVSGNMRGSDVSSQGAWRWSQSDKVSRDLY